MRPLDDEVVEYHSLDAESAQQREDLTYEEWEHELLLIAREVIAWRNWWYKTNPEMPFPWSGTLWDMPWPIAGRPAPPRVGARHLHLVKGDDQ